MSVVVATKIRSRPVRLGWETWATPQAPAPATDPRLGHSRLYSAEHRSQAARAGAGRGVCALATVWGTQPCPSRGLSGTLHGASGFSWFFCPSPVDMQPFQFEFHLGLIHFLNSWKDVIVDLKTFIKSHLGNKYYRSTLSLKSINKLLTVHGWFERKFILGEIEK